MDRKIIFAFIAICSFAASAALFFGGTDEINVTSVVDQPASSIVQVEASYAAAAAFRQDGGEVSDIVQLPVIIVRPEAIEQGTARDP